MNLPLQRLSRRDLFAAAGAALGGRLVPARFGDVGRVPHLAPHHPPKARAIIHLFMAGAPSPIDLFDDKPMLRRHDGQPVPEELLAGQRFAFLKGRPNLLGSPFSFRRHGDCGAEISE
ncbi:MAG: DUF1501 domain-containing protein, partial [Planctomycetota bacterium]